jgi:hypothetical protein
LFLVRIVDAAVVPDEAEHSNLSFVCGFPHNRRCPTLS